MEIEAKQFEPSVIISAIDKINSQALLPTSPVGQDAIGNMVLCAAACLAYAGFKIHQSSIKSDTFERRLYINRDYQTVFEAFKELGWSEISCTEWMTYNDSIHVTERKKKIIEKLKEAVDDKNRAVKE